MQQSNSTQSLTSTSELKRARFDTCNSGSTMDEEVEHQCASTIMLEEIKNPQFVSTYRAEIIAYLESEQINYLPNPHYMSTVQNDITPKMRTILVDWIEEVHMKFKLGQHCLYLAVNLIDRYLSICPVKRSRLQLVGISALFIAAKYEEIYPPNIKEFVYVCDKAYTKDEILKMEGQILHALKFQLNYASPLKFLEFKTIENTQLEQASIFQTYKFMLASYLIEISMHHYELLRYAPQQVAVVALYLAHRLLGINDESEMDENGFGLARVLAQQFWSNQTSQIYPAVRRKYAKDDYLQVSTLQFSIF